MFISHLTLFKFTPVLFQLLFLNAFLVIRETQNFKVLRGNMPPYSVEKPGLWNLHRGPSTFKHTYFCKILISIHMIILSGIQITTLSILSRNINIFSLTIYVY